MALTLYSSEGSNSAARVLWTLRYKGIPFSYQEIHNTQDPDYLRLNPAGYVPTLLVDGVPLMESMAICEFLHERYPHPSLLPSDTVMRAQTRALCEWINSTVHPAQNRTILKFLRPDLNVQDKRAMRAIWVSQQLTRLGSHLQKHSPYAVGSAFSLADIFVAVIFLKALEHGVCVDTLPKYHAHLKFLMNDQHIAASAEMVLGHHFSGPWTKLMGCETPDLILEK